MNVPPSPRTSAKRIQVGQRLYVGPHPLAGNVAGFAHALAPCRPVDVRSKRKRDAAMQATVMGVWKRPNEGGCVDIILDGDRRLNCISPQCMIALVSAVSQPTERMTP